MTTFSTPTIANGAYRMWRIPAHNWDGAEYGDEWLVVSCDESNWWATTEADQCVRRDLDADELAAVRRQFSLC